MVDKFLSAMILLVLMMIQSPIQSQDKIIADKGAQNISNPRSPQRLIKPETLKNILSSRQKGGIAIIHTGPPVLFKAGHIPGAIPVGPTSDSSGAVKLKVELQKIAKDKRIILYCGCCPWKNCPNVRPAYTVAHDMGFRNVEVLYLPNNFKIDWMKKGFPVEK